MRSTNKVAKYVAIALGLILAIFIISVIVKTTLGIFGAFGHFGKNAASSSVTNKEFSQEFNGVTSPVSYTHLDFGLRLTNSPLHGPFAIQALRRSSRSRNCLLYTSRCV